MNWISKIQRILGRFWSVVFSEHDFTLGVKNLHAMFANRQQQIYDSWKAGNIMAGHERYAVNLPYMIYLEKATSYTDEHGYTYMRSSVAAPAVSLDDILDNTPEEIHEGAPSLDSRDQHGGYVVKSRFSIPVPHHITDHVVDYTHTAFADVDYEWRDGAFLFHFDPSMMKFQETCVADDNGVLHVYWKAWGWCSPEAAIKDAVAAFDSRELNDYAETVWDIHTNGANYFNSRSLLGQVTDSVICKRDGAVDAKWTEQQEQCILIGDMVYHAPQDAQCNVDAGDSVRQGDTLFGTLRMVSSDDISADVPQSQIPGMRVMTDVGEMVAPNVNTTADYALIPGVSRVYARMPELDAPGAYAWTRPSGTVYTDTDTPVPHDTLIYSDRLLTYAQGKVAAYSDAAGEITEGVNFLPLRRTYSSSSDSAYMDMCANNMKNTECSIVAVPWEVNPFTFIMRALRCGSGIFAAMTVNTQMPIAQALACIRKNINASSMMTVYLQAEGDTVGEVAASFTATAGNAAVAVDATVTVQNMFAEAEIVI